MNQYQKHAIREAFTIIEMIVAIVVVGILFGGSMILLGLYINTSGKSREMFQATYLAQECIEMGRNYRDSLAKQNLKFEHNLDQLTGVPVNYNSDQSPSGENTLKAFGINTDLSEKFARINGEESQFERTIKVGNKVENSDHELESYTLVCKVSWDNDERNVTLSTVLTNWLK